VIETHFAIREIGAASGFGWPADGEPDRIDLGTSPNNVYRNARLSASVCNHKLTAGPYRAAVGLHFYLGTSIWQKSWL
jgi:hypothetical protein